MCHTLSTAFMFVISVTLFIEWDLWNSARWWPLLSFARSYQYHSVTLTTFRITREWNLNNKRFFLPILDWLSQLSFSVLNTSAGVITSMMRWFRRKTKANSEHACNSFLRSIVHFLFVIYNLMITEFVSDHRFISFQFQQETEEERSLEKMLESTGSYISLL